MPELLRASEFVNILQICVVTDWDLSKDNLLKQSDCLRCCVMLQHAARQTELLCGPSAPCC